MIQIGSTALMLASQYGSADQMKVVKYLVERGHAAITTKDSIYGQTAIFYAKSRGHTDVVHYLEVLHYLEVQVMIKMVMESNMLPFYTGVRGIIVKYLQ